ncbi:hypothetical protein DFQ28_003040 [Apophysomyces sp. BC1034]|nr:hypothetical protein DFQ28_003040 [Apophysomyces sp. BC1034]
MGLSTPSAAQLSHQQRNGRALETGVNIAPQADPLMGEDALAQPKQGVTDPEIGLVGDETSFYTANVGILPVAEAKILYVAYTKQEERKDEAQGQEGTKQDVETTRPITFFLSDSLRGAPCLSGACLLLGSFGPRVEEGLFDGTLPAREYNQATLLDRSDLVFVHPIAHGDFWGSRDATQMAADFIRDYLGAKGRRDSRLFLFAHGERVANHAIELIRRDPRAITGMALISSPLDPAWDVDHSEFDDTIAASLMAHWSDYLKKELDFDILGWASHNAAGSTTDNANVQATDLASVPLARRLVDVLSADHAPRVLLAYSTQEKLSKLETDGTLSRLKHKINVVSYHSGNRDRPCLDSVSRSLLRGDLDWLYDQPDSVAHWAPSDVESQRARLSPFDSRQENDASQPTNVPDPNVHESEFDYQAVATLGKLTNAMREQLRAMKAKAEETEDQALSNVESQLADSVVFDKRLDTMIAQIDALKVEADKQINPKPAKLPKLTITNFSVEQHGHDQSTSSSSTTPTASTASTASTALTTPSTSTASTPK